MEQVFETVFESERIRFVKLDVALVPDYLAMVNDIERVGRFIGRRTEPLTEEKETEWVRGKREANATAWSMIAKADGAFIGNVEIMDPENREGELGIALTAKRQDQGFGKEAIRAVLAYAKTTLGLNRIRLKVYPDNLRARHVYSACGFAEYGRSDGDVLMEIFL